MTCSLIIKTNENIVCSLTKNDDCVIQYGNITKIFNPSHLITLDSFNKIFICQVERDNVFDDSFDDTFE